MLDNDTFERHTLLGDWRHWKAGDEVLVRPHVAEKLLAEGLIAGEELHVADEQPSEKPARKQPKEKK